MSFLNEKISLRDLGIGLILEAFFSSISTAIVFPFDRAQLIFRTKNQKYSNLFEIFKDINTKEGIFGLWKGTAVTFFGYFPKKLAYFTSQSIVQRVDEFNNKSYWKSLFYSISSGIVVGSFVTLFIYPFEVVKTKLSLDVGGIEFSGAIDCLTKIIQTDGFLSLYRGIETGLAGIAIYHFLYTGIYELGRHLITKYTNSDSSSVLTLILGKITSIFTGITTYPFQVIKSRIIMETGKANKKYTNLVNW